ncbi:SIR2 family protein [Flavobacterium sp.]|uniref:SIR2 family protein n=1 Tax=Flavobacterium sp. TaxID=239 RepID=UPI00261F765C|nr:SIR2 family protein [Flavobacterium sp.]
MNSELLEHLQKFSTNPYLFVGSGLSRRYLSLPTWEALLIDFFNKSEIKEEFEYYQSKSNGNLPMLATILAGEFHEVWWKSEKFKESRFINKIIAKEKTNIPLKIEISNLIMQIQKSDRINDKEIQFLKTAVIDGIITTNWDQFLESNFLDYKVFIGQQELLFSESISIGEIYKIHGCISQPHSLIVTDEDYNDFNDRNPYLAAKLLTIFVEHPVIFIGYSLSDENIQQIIDSIVKCVDTKNLDKLKDRLIFIEWEKDALFEMKDSTIKLPENKVLPIKLIKTDSFEPIFETLSTLKRQIPVKILRKLKNSVVEFVKSSKPKSKIYIQDIDLITDDTKVEYAIGVGIASKLISAQGYRAIQSIDIIEDVLFDNKNYDSDQLIDNTFPSMLKGNIFMPIFKYLRAANLLSKNGLLNTNGINNLKTKFKLKANAPNCFLPSGSYLKKQSEIRRNHKDIKSIIKAFDKKHALLFIPLLEHKNMDLNDLRKFLLPCFNDENLKKETSFRKLVCLYDYLKYGVS